MRRLISLTVLLISLSIGSQELNCKLIVNAQQTGNENVQVFKTLEKSSTCLYVVGNMPIHVFKVATTSSFRTNTDLGRNARCQISRTCISLRRKRH